MSYGIAIQTAIYNQLSANIPYAVYDDVPQGSAFPYVTIGEDSITFNDTDNRKGAVATITIHTWSRYSGRSELKTMQGAIYDALHLVQLTHIGYKFVVITEQSATSFVDSDGETRHGVQEYQLIIDKEV